MIRTKKNLEIESNAFDVKRKKKQKFLYVVNTHSIAMEVVMVFNFS